MTFVADVRRRPAISRPRASTEPYVPEPTLELAEYDHILRIIGDMIQVTERSPHAFANIQEPVIRDHILVQLNGHYEGQATDETFNFEGKTDILIRAGGKILRCVNAVRDPALTFSQVVGRVGLEPTTDGL